MKKINRRRMYGTDTDIFDEMVRRWPSPIVAREKLPEFTGGVLSPGRAANLDSIGEGIPERFRVGRKICYPTKSVAKFLRGSSQNLVNAKGAEKMLASE